MKYRITGIIFWRLPLRFSNVKAAGIHAIFLAALAGPFPCNLLGDGPVFYRDVAPILYRECASCHRPGQAAPFSLIDFPEVRKHAEDIARVTCEGTMPPWPPEKGFGRFANARSLTDKEIETIERWVASGTPEGRYSDRPDLPVWKEGWQLGEPDLIVKMDRPYGVAAEGPDLYRNFVIPVPITTRKFVRAVEFRPGNARIVHHAFIKVDASGEPRRLDGQDGAPGYKFTMNSSGAQMPEGHFLSWTPGRIPSAEGEELAWVLEPGTDLVFQIHMRRTGKPETVQSEAALYFTDHPPALRPFKILLTSRALDIPAGEGEYVVNDQCRVAADADLIAILPHAHFLGKEMKATVILPNGTSEPLLWIRHWDFNWQTDYQYAKRMFLPKGAILSLRAVYDNSAKNASNPNAPPKRVTYGPQSTDEMCELWLQVVPRRREDLRALIDEFQTHMLPVLRAQYELALRLDPNDSTSESNLGAALLGLGDIDGASSHLRRATAMNPKLEEAHFYLGHIFQTQKKHREAIEEYEQVLQINPGNYQAEGNLGLIFFEEKKFENAQSHFESALRIFPQDTIARENLERLREVRRSVQKK